MTKEVKIGLIGIAALAMLIFGINYLKGINMFQSANYYYVEYTNINGLAGSSPVFANGYKVGTVRNINYNYANGTCHSRSGSGQGNAYPQRKYRRTGYRNAGNGKDELTP